MKTRRWMDTGRHEEPGIIVYRNIFRTEKTCRMELTYSADERAQFFLDGEYIGNGPERGCPDRWYRGTLVLGLTSGEHTLTARVLQFGEKLTAHGQMSVRHGLYIDNTDGVLSADWTFQREDGLTFAERWPDWGTFPKVILQKEYNCGILKGRGGEWTPVHWFEDDRQLYSPDLPSMRFDPVVPEKTTGGAMKFTAYTCAWCVYRFTGHGKVLIRWMETPYIENYLYDRPNLKGHKGRRDGTFFIADNDEFEIDGELEWYDYWWKAGHYTEIEVVSGNVEVSRAC